MFEGQIVHTNSLFSVRSTAIKKSFYYSFIHISISADKTVSLCDLEKIIECTMT